MSGYLYGIPFEPYGRLQPPPRIDLGGLHPWHARTTLENAKNLQDPGWTDKRGERNKERP